MLAHSPWTNLSLEMAVTGAMNKIPNAVLLKSCLDSDDARCWVAPISVVLMVLKNGACDFIVILQWWVIARLVSAVMGGGGGSADTSTANTWHCVPWANWDCAFAAVVTLFANLGGGGFGDWRKSVFFAMHPTKRWDLFPFPSREICRRDISWRYAAYNFAAWNTPSKNAFPMLWRSPSTHRGEEAWGSLRTVSTSCQPWVRSFSPGHPNIPDDAMWSRRANWSIHGINGSSEFLML